MRLIDAGLLREMILDLRYRLDENDQLLVPLRDVLKRIDSVQTVEPMKHGKWIKAIIKDRVRCSACRYEIPIEYEPKRYCPNCGAKMEEKTT